MARLSRFHFHKLENSALTLLIWLFVGVVILSFLQANLNWLWPEAPPIIHQLSILDTESSITILVALLGLKITLRSYHQSHSPKLTYKSLLLNESLSGLSKEHQPFWNVSLSNIGSGMAENISYEVEWSWAVDGTVKKGEVSAFHADAKLKNWLHGQDYELNLLSTGFALAQGGVFTLFEMSTKHRPAIKQMKLILHYENIHGDRFKGIINCLPKA
jgi:hypothetical protein